MSSKRNNNYISSILAVVFGILFIACLWLSSIRNQKVQQLSDVKNRTEQLENQIQEKQTHVDMAAYQAALNNPNDSIRINSRQAASMLAASDKADKLFDILMTYSSSKQFNSRAERAVPYASAGLRSNTNIFGDDIQDGTHFVDASGLHSKYASVELTTGLLKGDEMPVLANVHFISWYDGQNKSSNRDLYVGTYNYKLKKFTSLNRLNNLFRGNLNNDMN